MSQPQDLLDSVSGQLRNLPLLATPETCSGRSYIVTGANSGLGFEAAKQLVSLGAGKVILAVRNLSAGEKAKADIEASTGKTGSSEVWHLDLSNYESVKAFAKRATLELDRIDALIENAGVAIDMSNQAEGHPATFTVNVSVAFSAQPLWDLGKDNANPMNKIVQVGQLDMTSGYTVSKLLEVLAVRHIAPLIPVSSTGVVLNLVCPGLCKTEIGRNATDDIKAVAGTMMDQIGRTSEDGSRTLLFAAIAGKESHGKFTADCEIKDDSVIPDWIKGKEAEEGRKRLWNAITNEIESAAPGSIAKVFS